MSDSNSERSPREQQLDALIAEYYHAAEQGQPVNQAEILQRHPEFASELRDFFADVGQIERVVPAARLELEETQPPEGASPTRRNPGTKVPYLGDYEILEELGAGGMGVVYKARQTKLKKIVALKMIKVGQLASDEEVRRFQAEARAAAKLDHPGIVAVHEVGVDHRQHYYAMDFVGGGSLSALHREAPLAARQAAELVKKLAEAMHYAHGQGIVHRDLKPANVLLTTNGTPRITDFGLAKRLWSDDDSAGVTMTETGQVLGTAGYMSPEQAAGKTRLVGPPSDIYSLGAILYALLTSRAPFVGESQADTILQVIQKEPISPRTLNPSVPRDLETICLKCLEKEPHKRYGTAQLLADDLGRFLEGRSVLARPINLPARAWRWCRRNPMVAGLSCAMLILLILGTLISSIMAIIAERRGERLAEAVHDLGNAITEKDGALTREREQRRIAETSLKTSQWNTYVARIYNLTTAWREQGWGELDRLSNELVPHEGQPDFRGWEWYYLRDQYDSQIRFFSKRNNQYVFVRFSPDGNRLAIRRDDEKIEIWDVNQLVKERELPGKKGRQLAWNPTGTLLAAQENDGVRIYNTQDGRETAYLKSPHNKTRIKRGYGLDWSDDGNRIALGGDGWIEYWRSNGEFERTVVYDEGDSDDACWALAWHPDGKRLALATHGGITRLFDADNGTEIWQRRVCNINNTDVQWNADGTQLAVGAHYPIYQTIILTEHGKILKTLEKDRSGYAAICWSPDGERIATKSEDEHVNISNVKTGEVVFRAQIHSSPVRHLAWRPGSDEIVSVGEDGGIRLWRAEATFQRSLEIPFPGIVRNLAWHPKRPLVAAAGANSVMMFNTDTGLLDQELIGHLRLTQALDWHPSGTQLASVDTAGEIRLWNLATNKTEWILDSGSTGSGVYQMSYSPDGRYLACAGNETAKADGKRGVRVFDLDNERAEVFFDAGYRGTLVWNPNSRLLLTGDYDPGVVKLWDVSTNSLLWSEKHWSIVHCAFRPDGKQVATGHTNGNFQVRRATDGALLRTERGNTSEVSRIFWSPNQSRIATISHVGQIRIWDAATGDELLVLPAHIGRSDALCWSRDGMRIASGGRDKFIRIWGSSRIEQPLTPIAFDGNGVLAKDEPQVSKTGPVLGR